MANICILWTIILRTRLALDLCFRSNIFYWYPLPFQGFFTPFLQQLHTFRISYSNSKLNHLETYRFCVLKIFGSFMNFGRFLADLSLNIPPVFCIWFVSIFSHFRPSLIEIAQVVAERVPKTIQKKTKIGQVSVKFSPWGWTVGKNLM